MKGIRLFPFKEDTEVYHWNDEFSNYVDVAKDWQGTGRWSAYDKKTGIFVIIGASQTDQIYMEVRIL